MPNKSKRQITGSNGVQLTFLCTLFSTNVRVGGQGARIVLYNLCSKARELEIWKAIAIYFIERTKFSSFWPNPIYNELRDILTYFSTASSLESTHSNLDFAFFSWLNFGKKLQFWFSLVKHVSWNEQYFLWLHLTRDGQNFDTILFSGWKLGLSAFQTILESSG